MRAKVMANLGIVSSLLLICGITTISCVASFGPPYMCTTATTICEPGDEGRAAVPAASSNEELLSQGRPGKRGNAGITGEKGDKGDPCRCNIADDEAMANMSRRMEMLEADNAQLREMQSGYGKLGSPSNPGKSCLQLRQEGRNVSGIYSIQIDEKSSLLQVYCDMDSAGGGWTLVASIHENNIDGKCTQGDLWSSEQSGATDFHLGSRNWENFNHFGSPDAATSADYKSEAYYSMQGSDVMIWHVPNEVNINHAYEEAVLKYYTNTSFLDDYGGNLQSLFHERFPLVKGDLNFKPNAITSVMSELRRQSTSIQGVIPNFFRYAYDGDANNEIKDGGSDMYDNGNQVFYRIGSNAETRILYNEHYRNTSHGVEFISSSSQHPFHALMWISNDERTEQSYAMRVVTGSGADGAGSYTTRSGSLSFEGFSLNYHAFSVYGATDPSICEVFYYIQSDIWGSIVPSVSKLPWTAGTDNMDHGVVFGGTPRSFLIGYTLLSRTSGAEVTDSYIRSALDKILKMIPSQTDKTKCNPKEEILVQPVIYLKGDDSQISARIPPSVRSRTSTGFIQFRAFNEDGFPNAFCPGIKTSNCRPKSLCVGGINTMSTDERACGDFAGWQGDSSDSPSRTRPVGAAKSLNDVNSSILIFTRAQA